MPRSPEQVREAKRLHMARRRAENPEGVRNYQRQLRAKNPERTRAKLREYYARRFFWGRAMTDAEFETLCADVMRWIGERIQAVEALTESVAA